MTPGKHPAGWHPGHTPFSEDVRNSIILLIFVALMFSVVLIFSGLPGHGPVQANYTNGAVAASAIFVILILTTTLDLLYYIATHFIGKPEGRT